MTTRPHPHDRGRTGGHPTPEEHQVYDEDDDFDEYDDEFEDDGEWQPGECDHCSGGDENGVTATGPLGPLYCACFIGQGAAPEDCVCGPVD